MINFIIPSEKSITRYLNVHPELLGLVLKIVDQLNEKFDEDLEVEIINRSCGEGLLINIRCKNYATVMKRIKEIRQSDFYKDTLINSKGWLLLTTDFKKLEG